MRALLEEVERDWLLGSEPELWNNGIARGVRQLERIVKEEKRGEEAVFKMHRLLLKKNEEVKLYAMKSAPVRAI